MAGRPRYGTVDPDRNELRLYVSLARLGTRVKVGDRLHVASAFARRHVASPGDEADAHTMHVDVAWRIKTYYVAGSRSCVRVGV